MEWPSPLSTSTSAPSFTNFSTVVGTIGTRASAEDSFGTKIRIVAGTNYRPERTHRYHGTNPHGLASKHPEVLESSRIDGNAARPMACSHCGRNPPDLSWFGGHFQSDALPPDAYASQSPGMTSSMSPTQNGPFSDTDAVALVHT